MSGPGLYLHQRTPCCPHVTSEAADVSHTHFTDRDAEALRCLSHTVLERCVVMWTSVGHAALQTDSRHEGLFLSGGFFDNRLQAAICGSIGHLLPTPRTALVSAPRTGTVIIGAHSSSLRDSRLPGHCTSTSQAERDLGLWALISALPLTSNAAIDESLLFSVVLEWLPRPETAPQHLGSARTAPGTGVGVGPGAGSLLPTQLTLSTLYCCPLGAQRHASFPQTLYVAEARSTGSCGVRV